MNINEKLGFIQNVFCEKLKSKPINAIPSWGKMSLHQMIEHIADFFKVSTNKIQFPIVSAPEHLPKLKEFLLSDKEFRENTKAPEQIVPAESLPTKQVNVEAAIDFLQSEINYFVDYYTTDKNRTAKHPVFGELNFEEWILLHYKHVTHNCKQFGLV